MYKGTSKNVIKIYFCFWDKEREYVFNLKKTILFNIFLSILKIFPFEKLTQRVD